MFKSAKRSVSGFKHVHSDDLLAIQVDTYHVVSATQETGGIALHQESNEKRIHFDQHGLSKLSTVDNSRDTVFLTLRVSVHEG